MVWLEILMWGVFIGVNFLYFVISKLYVKKKDEVDRFWCSIGFTWLDNV